MVQLQTKTCQDYCLDVAEKIQARLGTDVQHEHGMSFSSMMSRYSQTLPSDSNLENDGTIIDLSSKNALQAMNSINWWAMPCPQFYPLNCPNSKNVAKLCHSASISMWGINDCILADTMRKALTDDEKNGKKLFNRWVAVNNFELQTDQVKLVGWKKIKDAVSDETIPLDTFHIFLLANILRRPIMIIGLGSFVGMYLPLLWPESNTIKSPLVLGERSEILPLLYQQPESGRDFVPIENAKGEQLPIRSLINKEKALAENLLKYMDIQQQPVLVNSSLVNLQLAKLNTIEMSYDLCIIEQYLEGVSNKHVDLEAFIVADRWSQLAIGFPPMDWHLPKQISLYNISFGAPSSEHMDYEKPEEAQTTVLSASGNDSFFNRNTVEVSEKNKFVEEPKKPDIKAKRAMFKRTNTLSDMGPGFGGRRGAMIGGEMDTSGPVRNPTVVAARPGLGTRVRSKKKYTSAEMISEEAAESDNPLEQKLKAQYKVAEKSSDEPRGFVADRSILRANDKIKRQLSASNFISPC